MKALLIVVIGSILLAGCSSTSTMRMSEEDRALWETDPSPAPAK